IRMPARVLEDGPGQAVDAASGRRGPRLAKRSAARSLAGLDARRGVEADGLRLLRRAGRTQVHFQVLRGETGLAQNQAGTGQFQPRTAPAGLEPKRLFVGPGRVPSGRQLVGEVVEVSELLPTIGVGRIELHRGPRVTDGSRSITHAELPGNAPAHLGEFL